MADKNLDQIFIANPITTNASTDLMYFMQSPYTPGTDAAMTYANFSAQFGAPYTPAALTRTNDTNVTLTLGGTPSTALLHAASITAGWTGTLSGARGGTGVANTGLTINLGSATTGDVLTSDSLGNATWQAPSGGSVTPADIQNQAFTYAAGSGPANTYATNLTPAVASYSDGAIYLFRSLADNTGASTLNVNGLGALPILDSSGNPLVGGEILATLTYMVLYSFANNAFELINSSVNGGGGGVTSTQVQDQAFTYAADSGTANHYAITLSPVATLHTGQIFQFKALNTNTGASDFSVNGSTPAPIFSTVVGTALNANEILAGNTYIVLNCNNGAFFVLINSSLLTNAVQIQNQYYSYATDFGAANAYAIAMNETVASLVDGQLFTFLAANTNSGASTLTVDSTATTPIVTNGNSALVGGEILANGSYVVMYNGTYTAFVLINSSLSGGGGGGPSLGLTTALSRGYY